MAQVTITIFDVEDGTGRVRMRGEFEPAITKEQAANMELTNAQVLAVLAMATVQEEIERDGGEVTDISNAGDN